MAAIRTTNLTKSYGSVDAVSGLDLVVEEGEVFGFLGANGAGKSTTINLLLDLVRPTAGEISVLGADPQSNPQSVRERVGTLPESQEFYHRLTAVEHLRFAVETADADDEPMALLDRVGLRDAANRPVSGYSTGMRRRLALALALVGTPELLILDEPLTGVDPAGLQLFHEIIDQERQAGTTVFFSSHIMSHVETFCDRIGIMNDGELVFSGSLSAFRAQAGETAEFSVTVDETPPDVALTDIDGVDSVEWIGRTVRADCDTPEAKLAVVERIRAAGTDIQEFGTDARPLDELFVEYLREER